jgi:hypothetical protein
MAGEREEREGKDGEEKRKRRNKKRKRKEQKEKKKKGFYVFSIKMNVDLIEGYNFKWLKVQGR